MVSKLKVIGSKRLVQYTGHLLALRTSLNCYPTPDCQSVFLERSRDVQGAKIFNLLLMAALEEADLDYKKDVCNSTIAMTIKTCCKYILLENNQ